MANEHLNRRSSIDVRVSLKLDGATGFTELKNVSDIPDLGGSRENIDVTAIGDDRRKYIAGIAEDASELEFTCWYEKEAFEAAAKGGVGQIKVAIGEVKDGVFTEEHATYAKGHISAALAGFGVGDALTYTLKMNVEAMGNEEITEGK